MTKSQFPADLIRFTEEVLNGKLNFLCSVDIQHLSCNFSLMILRWKYIKLMVLNSNIKTCFTFHRTNTSFTQVIICPKIRIRTNETVTNAHFADRANPKLPFSYRADSITWDAHKMMSSSLTCSVLLVKEKVRYS